MVEIRRCTQCSSEKLLIEFQVYNSKSGWRRHECKTCMRARHNAYYWGDLENQKKLAAEKYKKNPSSQWTEKRRTSARTNAKRYSRELREVVIRHYGARCACCGESHPGFLTLDHIKNDGCQMRKEHGVGLRLYRWIVRNNYPEIFQVLCYNCNCGRALNDGICPHNLQGRFNDYPAREYAASDWQRKRPAPRLEVMK